MRFRAKHRAKQVAPQWLVATLLLGAMCARAAAQTPAPAAAFERTNVRIAMRDGVELNTDIYAPKAMTGPLPIIMRRTPYGIDGAAGNFGGYFKELAADGYIFVFQDIRGRYKSGGQFVMQRPPRDRNALKSVDEASDTYDTIDWLLAHVPNNNGRVGMLGVSYDGWLSAMALTEPHPALKAVSPQASPADMYLGDDFHHNGAFRLSYGFEYAAMMETGKENANFAFDRYDTYEWYLNLGALKNANAKYLHDKLPTWNDFVAHPNYDAFWKRQTLIPNLTKVTVPTLNVAGWWDQEDFYGPLAIYKRLEQLDANHLNFLVVGPWNHGGWSRGEGQKLGNIDFGSATSLYFREKIQAPWFAHFLKDRSMPPQPEALTFESGANEWKSYDAWPPKRGVTNRNLFFQPAGRLAFEQPKAAGPEFDSYVSDPAHPVPYRARPIQPTYYPGGSGWPAWLLEDQRFVDDRPDVLSWETEPLTDDVVVAGDIAAHLFAATSGTDGDWVVKLIDVYPEQYAQNPKLGGYQLMVSNDVFRGRFRKSFEKPEAIVPNQVNEYVVDLHGQDYRFLKGHKIMVQVQSSWFPLIDRNPQTFVPNIFAAKESDFRPATQRVYRSSRFPSHLSLPIVSPATLP